MQLRIAAARAALLMGALAVTPLSAAPLQGATDSVVLRMDDSTELGTRLEESARTGSLVREFSERVRGADVQPAVSSQIKLELAPEGTMRGEDAVNEVGRQYETVEIASTLAPLGGVDHLVSTFANLSDRRTDDTNPDDDPLSDWPAINPVQVMSVLVLCLFLAAGVVYLFRHYSRPVHRRSRRRRSHRHGPSMGPTASNAKLR